ncbi:MAG: hypothetical protein PVH82_10625, partial [Desulfobacteraceae bacterium]
MNAIEQKILAYAAELNPDSGHHARLRRLMSQHVNVDHLIDLADKEGLTCLVYKNFEKSGLLEALQPDTRERLQSSYYKTAG